MIYYGTQLYGKVDVVPGAFFVATRFVHIYFVPLFPVGSFIVLEQSGNQFRGVKTRLSFKSILLAYGRALCFVAAVATILRMIGAMQQGQSSTAMLCGAIVLAAVGLLVGSWKLKALTRARYERACVLAQRAGFNALGLEALRRLYGKAAEYSPPAAPTPPRLPGNRQPAR